LYALVHGDIGVAVGHNPLLMVFLAWLVGWGLRYSLYLWFPQRFLAPRPRKATAFWHWGVFVIVILYTVARNLPWAPFNLLAPG